MSQSSVNTRTKYAPTVFHNPDTPLRGRLLFNIASACNSVRGIGKHHFSTWLGNRVSWPDTNGVTWPPEAQAYLFQTKVTPSVNANYLYITALVEGREDEGAVGFNRVYYEVPAGNSKTGPSADAKWYQSYHLSELTWEYAVTGGEEIEIYWLTSEAFIVRGLTVFDAPRSIIGSNDSGYCDPTQYQRGKILTTTSLASLIDNQALTISDLRKEHVNNATVYDGETLWYQTWVYDTWQNVMDASLSVYSSTSPGYWIRPSAAWDSDNELELTIQVLAAAGSDTIYLKAATEGYESDAVEVSSEEAWIELTLYVPVPFDYHQDYKCKVDILCYVIQGEVNLLDASEEFDDTDHWTPAHATITPDQMAWPTDDDIVADLVYEVNDGDLPPHNVSQSIAHVESDNCFSCYVNRSLERWCCLFLNSGTTVAWFDIITGVVGTATNGTSGIETIDANWYRCWVAGDATPGVETFGVGIATDNEVWGYNPEGGLSGIYICGAQFETGVTTPSTYQYKA